MQAWREHLARPEIALVGYGFFGIILVGLVWAWRRNLPWWRGLVLVWWVGFAALANATWPFSVLVEWLRSQNSILAQVFRVPFTKFGVVAGFGYSVVFGLGVVRWEE